MTNSESEKLGFIFDPMAQPVVPNSAGVFHLAAWRGDVWYMQQLIQHGADINGVYENGRNALHVLYQMCNKPNDLLQATKTLIEGGVDVATKDVFGQTPLMVLLPYAFKNSSTQAAHKDLCGVVLDCMETLLDAAVESKAAFTVTLELLLQTAVETFADSLTLLEDISSDDTRVFACSSYTPYTCDVNRLNLLVSCLVRRGCQVSHTHSRTIRGQQAALHLNPHCS